MPQNNQQKSAIDWRELLSAPKEMVEKATPYMRAARGAANGVAPVAAIPLTPVSAILGALVGAGMGGEGNRLHGAVHGAGRGFGTALGAGLGGLTMGAPIGAAAGYMGAPVVGGGAGALAGGGAGGVGGYHAGAGLAKLMTGEDAPWTKKKTDKKENKDKEQPMASEKSAKVYEASEHLDGAKPKVTMMNHKCCTPGEFGMRVKEAFEKQAIPAFGGRNYSLAPRGFGVGVNAGYDYLGGVVPDPYVGIDIGTPHTGVGISGPIPGISLRSGMFSRPPGATSGHNRSNLFGHRSLWKYLADSYSGRPQTDVEKEVLNDRLQSMRNVTKDEFHEAIPHYHGSENKPLSKSLHNALTDYYHTHSRPEAHEDREDDKDEKKKEKKANSARDFGAAVKLAFLGNYTMPVAGGAALGAGLGGLAGLVNPGEEDHYDDNGKVIGRKPRSRLSAALSGAMAGGLGGGALGAGAQYAGYGKHIGGFGAQLAKSLGGAAGGLYGMMGGKQKPKPAPVLTYGQPEIADDIGGPRDVAAYVNTGYRTPRSAGPEFSVSPETAQYLEDMAANQLPRPTA